MQMGAIQEVHGCGKLKAFFPVEDLSTTALQQCYLYLQCIVLLVITVVTMYYYTKAMDVISYN